MSGLPSLLPTIFLIWLLFMSAVQTNKPAPNRQGFLPTFYAWFYSLLFIGLWGWSWRLPGGTMLAIGDFMLLLSMSQHLASDLTQSCLGFCLCCICLHQSLSPPRTLTLLSAYNLDSTDLGCFDMEWLSLQPYDLQSHDAARLLKPSRCYHYWMEGHFETLHVPP